MNLLIENARQIVTCGTGRKKFKSGRKQSDIGLIENASIYIEKGVINWIGHRVPKSIIGRSVKKIDAKNKVVMPGFIDSHTHLVFAGDRADEYSMRLAGKSYEAIARSEGGIINTVKAVRKSSKDKLKELSLQRIKNFISFGVTILEAKSGYGLDTENEIKMLEVINELNKECPIEVIPTFLGAHAILKNKGKEEYIEQILYEMIPLIAKKKLAKFIDVFCELNYFSAKETEEIFRQGVKFGMIPKLHTNQFYSVGGIKAALNHKAISVDHLEVMKPRDIELLKDKNIIACLLPGVSYFLDIGYAPARKLIDCNIPVALATDFNPGTCMTENIQFIMSLAAQKLRMNIEEIINAVTINAAAALGISDRVGSIEIGKEADIVIFDMQDYRHLTYHFGVNNLERVIKNGEMVKL